jgi:hypothetical protein
MKPKLILLSVEGNDVPHHESLTRILQAHSAATFANCCALLEWSVG